VADPAGPAQRALERADRRRTGQRGLGGIRGSDLAAGAEPGRGEITAREHVAGEGDVALRLHPDLAADAAGEVDVGRSVGLEGVATRDDVALVGLQQEQTAVIRSL